MELQAMEQVFCQGRQKPLLVGSVVSNIGFTDASTGSSSIFKILLGYQRGVLAPTIHCENPRQDVAAIRDGRMRVVTDPQQFNSSYAAVNSISETGVNGHALLHGFRKAKDLSKYKSDIPYLITVSGRQESAVQKIMDDITSRHLDPEEIALFHNIFRVPTTNHLARGFGIYSTKNGVTMTHHQKVDYYDNVKQPLWFVYSGMGSQWVGMGTHLMRIPIFAESIARCHKVLEPKGIDLIGIITSEDPHIFDNILHSFVGISSIQVALTDLLRTIGLVPDKIVGHSLGEAACAYVDGCLSLEQVMMLSYIRGLVSTKNKLEHGAMAAVGLGYKQLSKICPPHIDIACRNSATSSTISGPYEDIKRFVEQLTAERVFAKEVQSSNIAYHSRYIAKIGPEFLEMVKEVIPTPKLRSERWISSSVPPERWNEPGAKYSSAEYHTNNLLNAVLFEEALRFIPANAVVVEVAPHALLQAILKRALPSCRLVPLTRRAHADNALFCLEGIGNLYMTGYDPDISALYPKIEFPVSAGTRPLGHLVEWSHTEKWKLCRYLDPIRAPCSVYRQIVTVKDDEFQYLKGNVIEGTRVFPFAACLVAVWDTLAMTNYHERRTLSVQFQNVKFHCQPPVRDLELVRLITSVQRGSGQFEVYDGNVILVEGTITATKKGGNVNHTENENISMCLNKEDIYKLFFERGYDYNGPFRAIHSMDASMSRGFIEWQDNWMAFIDAILQMHVLHSKHEGITSVVALKNMVIDVKENARERVSNNLIYAVHDEIMSRTRCGGVTIDHVTLKHKPVKKQAVSLQTLKFVPFDQPENCDMVTALSTTLQIVAENVDSKTISMYYFDDLKKQDYFNKIKNIKHGMDFDVNIMKVKREDILERKVNMNKPDVAFMHDLLSDKKILEELYNILPTNTFIISVGIDSNASFPPSLYKKISSIGSGRSRLELGRFKPNTPASNTTAITIRNTSDIYQLRTTCESLPSQHKLLILAPNPAPSGLKDQVKFWRRECHKNVSLVMFDPKNSMDKEMESIPDMAISILKQGVWGGEYYIPTKLEPISLKGAVSLTCTRTGDLDSLSWTGIEEPTGPGVEVTVHYAGLVGSDAARAQGRAHTSVEGGFGMDFSGVTASGERVMGLMARGSASTKVRVDPTTLWPVPAHWTMKDAATVPFAYCYALYILTRKCRPLPGQTILVHGGAGALGQALISVALACKLNVYTTVSDVRKKHFLRKLFPELKDDHIGNSRDDTSFRVPVKYLTKGMEEHPLRYGADIVVSCATGKLKNLMFDSCSPNGIVVDTAQLVTGEDFQLGMYSWSQMKSYAMTDFSSIFTEDNQLELRWLQLMLSQGIVNGYVRPLSRVTYSPSESSRAFRLLAASRHRGRVLLAMQESAPHPLPRISCLPARSYLVVYEDEDLGVRFADLLVKRGAKKLHLHTKQSSYLKYKIQSWEKLGVQVKVSSNNLTKKTEVMSLLEQCNNNGVLDGIFVVTTNSKQKTDVMSAMLTNLDVASRKVCSNLRHFAIVSEDDCAWRDTVTERARHRLPALSLLVPKMERFETSETIPERSPDGFSTFHALQAIEEALFSGDHVVAAYAQVNPPRSVLEEVAKIPGINITNATVDRTRLEQVGADHGRAQEVSNVLRERFGIMILPKRVPKMTIGQLKQLKQDPIDTQMDTSGFGAYISTVDEDELQATCEVVQLPTLKQRSDLRADEFDSNQNSLCIIPGLEGHHARFQLLCERLKVPAVVFQHGHNHLNDSFQETAQRLANLIMKYLKPKQTFNILGYEFGVMLSLEVADILESYGLTGKVYLLGGTPEDIRSSFNARWKDKASIQNALILHMYQKISKTTSKELDEAIRQCQTWEDKLDCMLQLLPKTVSHTKQYMKGITEGIYSRVKLLQGYDIQPHKLKSKVILVQTEPYKSTIQNLKPFTNQEPEVINLNTTLEYAHIDLDCPSIINKYLDPLILEIFEHSNQCDTVLINDDYIRHSVVDDE